MSQFVQKLVLLDDAPPRAVAIAIVVIMAAVSAWLYHVAHIHADTVNTDVYKNDQYIYLDGAKELAERDYDYFIPRQRMPAYYYFLSVFWDEDMDHEAFFRVAKHLNIIVTIVLLFGILAFSRMFLPWTESALMALIPGACVFVLKAGYAQPEIFLMAITYVCATLLLRMMHRPSWTLAMVTGICMWLWQYTKSSAMVALILFCGAYAVKYLWMAYREEVWRAKERFRPWILTVARGILVPLLFLTLFYPYARESKEVFGSWFYSVHTRYLFWCDTPEQKQQVNTLKLAIRPTEVPAEELPSPGKFWREHSLKEILERPIAGVRGQINRVGKYYRGFARLIWFYFWVAVIAAVLRRRRALELLREHFFEGFFIAIFSITYLALCGWWEPLGLGARIIMAFSLVPLFASLWWISRVTEGWSFEVKGVRIFPRKLIHTVGGLLLMYYGWEAFTVTINSYRGS